MSQASTFRTIEVDTTAPVGRITLARPKRLNALSDVLMGELIDAAAWFHSADEVRTVVVAGQGRAFCAGVDLETAAALLAEPDADRQRAGAELGGHMADAIEGMRQVTIAALHGHVVGGGMVLAAACDLRVAAIDTRFAIPEVDMGIPLAWGGIARLVRAIGPARTKELVLTCRPFGAEEAKELGFVNQVVGPDEVETAALDLAELIAAKPAFAVDRTKAHVNAVAAALATSDPDLDDATGLMQALASTRTASALTTYVGRVRKK